MACIAGDTNHVDSFRLTLANFSQFARDAVYPYGAGGPNASFAFLTAYYMQQHGATREDFGKLCVAQRANALKFDSALFKKPLTELNLSELAEFTLAMPPHGYWFQLKACQNPFPDSLPLEFRDSPEDV